MIHSNLVEKENRFIPEKFFIFRRFCEWRPFPEVSRSPARGKKHFRVSRTKKAVVPRCPVRLQPFPPAIPWPLRLFRRQRGGTEETSPAFFGFGACFLARATGTGAERPITFEMIHSNKSRIGIIAKKKDGLYIFEIRGNTAAAGFFARKREK